MVSDIENTAPLPVTRNHNPVTAQKQPNVPKKKKKRKNTASSNPSASASSLDLSPTPDPLDESTPLPNEQSIRGDGLEQWRARARNRRSLIASAAADNAILTADLNAALARVSDAEHAEATVNKGLVTARSVISQRDRALADLTTAHTVLKADHAKVVEEKRRSDKRLIILKTVSANLQEAREARDLAEKKLEDANAVNASLSKEVESLKKQVEALNMVKQQLSRVENELDELTQSKEQLHVDAKNATWRAASFGAAGVMALNLTLRLVARGKK